jgi:SAM-dependent methyltransferase
MNVDFWNQRYSAEAYAYGVEPNDFLVEQAHHIPAGRVLCLAEGEGRNAVYLAKRGYEVTALDMSAAGLAKAQRLAATAGVAITTQLADLESYEIEPEAWQGIVSIFAHVPPPLRRRLYDSVVRGLRPGGVAIVEAYTPRQLHHQTGGPRQLELLVSLEMLREELHGLNEVVGREMERQVVEGEFHTGLGAVVQYLARREA